LAVLFPRWSNRIPALIAGTVLFLGPLVVGAVNYYFSPLYTDVGYAPEQPVAFSHKLHAGELGMDCRYCHNTVEAASHAAVPPAATCMNCHGVIKADSEKLSPIRESYEADVPVEWVRVHMLPDYAYFDHSVHLSAGVGCASCHGRIDQMKVVTQDQPLSMGWCLDCHRNPTPHLRPAGEITNMAYNPAEAGYLPDEDVDRVRDLHPPEHCSGCHR
jgi:hypothetical protein